MESIVDNTITVTLKLSEKEALWLKGVVQNPFHCTIGNMNISDVVEDRISRDIALETESQENKEMRGVFWEALADVKL